jgi:hypothetical protein
MAEKAVIHIFNSDETLPFDVKDYRAVPYSLANPKNIEEAKKKLHEQVEAILEPDFKVSNPVTAARGHQKVNESADPKDQIIADLLERVKEIESWVYPRTAAGPKEHVWKEPPRDPDPLIVALKAGKVGSNGCLEFPSTAAATPDWLASVSRNPKRSGDM